MKQKAYYIPRFRTITLKNGLKVFWHERPTINTIGIGLFVRIGGANEPIEGIAHLIEHLIVASTRPRLEAPQIGASIGAETLRVYTQYNVSVLPENFAKTTQVLGEMFFQPDFKEEMVRAEKNRIINEIAEAGDDPDGTAFNRLVDVRFLEKNSVFRDIGGRKSAVSELNLQRIRNIYARYYHPRNACLVISAPFSLNKTSLKSINQAFGKRHKPKPPFVKERKTTFSQFRVQHFLKTGINQTYLFISVPVWRASTPRIRYSLQRANGLIDKLLQPIKEDGLAYRVGSTLYWSGKIVFFSIYGIFNNTNDLEKALRRIIEGNGLNYSKDYLRNSFEITKASAIKSLLIDFESDAETISEIGAYYMIENRVPNFEDIFNEIRRMSYDRTIRIAKRMINTPGINIVTFGNPKHIPAVRRIVRSASPILRRR
ncbi:MAG: insulinase family protein [Candidatus Colwellbacteria bacterium]|nr:insulinase family protein [Candidatus Colwellbacteria bacterium]